MKSIEVLIATATFCSHGESNFCLFLQKRMFQASVTISLEGKVRDKKIRFRLVPTSAAGFVVN